MSQPAKKRRRNDFIDNKLFYSAIRSYRQDYDNALEQGRPTPDMPRYIGKCFLDIASHLSMRPNFSNYMCREDMVMDAVENCFHRSTKIMTIEHGNIEIEKIVGEEVTIKAKDGQWRKAIVKSYGIQELYEYTIGAFNVSVDSCHQKVIATKNHRWFVTSRRNVRGRVIDYKGEVTDLRVGDCLENAPNLDGMNLDAIIHGLVFGDGSGHKTQSMCGKCVDVQGSNYARIRVCKQDSVGDEIKQILSKAGYTPTYPDSAHGDACYSMGDLRYVKDLPYTTDPEYIAGFIYGWWLADGSKTTNPKRVLISTSREDAALWLKDNAAFAGLQVTSYRDRWGDTQYKDNRRLIQVIMTYPDMYEPKVRDVKYYGKDEVFCLEEPVTKGFVLGNGLLTGNCVLYWHRFDPERSKNPFSYFTQVCWYAFIRRIGKEKKQIEICDKIIEKSGFEALFESDAHGSSADYNSIKDAVDQRRRGNK